MNDSSVIDIIPVPLEDIYVTVKTNNGKNITYTDCFECSLLRIIQLLILDLNGYENVDIKYLRSKTSNKQIINFFEKYPMCNNKLFENTDIRSEWASILNELDDIYYHRDIHGNLIDDYSKKNYEVDTIIENFINIFWNLFDLLDWKQYISIMPIERFMDIERYQIFFDLITKNFERDKYIVKIHIIEQYRCINNEIKSQSNSELTNFFSIFYSERDVIFLKSIIKVNNNNIWKWILYSWYYMDKDNLIDGHSEISNML
jgi:hypothetical protein